MLDERTKEDNCVHNFDLYSILLYDCVNCCGKSTFLFRFHVVFQLNFYFPHYLFVECNDNIVYNWIWRYFRSDLFR